MKKQPIVLLGKDYELGNQLRKDVLLQLRNELCSVRFVKADGTRRYMQCTLLETFLPPPTDAYLRGILEKGQPKPNPNLITVWDIEKNAWRAFRLETFLRLTVIS
jgi:hypothetical protein